MIKKFVEKIDNPSVVTEIMKNWINDKNVKGIFQKYNIDNNFFVTNFGIKILDYFVLVFAGKTEIGNCPYIEKFLEYLDEIHISVGELFLICSGLKKSIIEYVLNEDFSDEEKNQLFDEIYNIFDKNLAGVLNNFVNKNFYG